MSACHPRPTTADFERFQARDKYDAQVILFNTAKQNYEHFPKEQEGHQKLLYPVALA